MSDCGSRPIGGHDIHRSQFPQIERLVVIGGRVVSLASIVEIANVVDSDLVAVDGGVGQHGKIRLPIAFVGRLDTRPKKCQTDAQHPVRADRRPAPAWEEQRDQRRRGSHGEADHQRVTGQVVARARVLQQQPAPRAGPRNQKSQGGEARTHGDPRKQTSLGHVDGGPSPRALSAANQTHRCHCSSRPPGFARTAA